MSEEILQDQERDTLIRRLYVKKDSTTNDYGYGSSRLLQ
jgi:hypothetical protein